MNIFLNDTEIAELINEEKHISESFSDLYKMKEKKGHKEFELTIERPDKSFFKIIVRVNKENPMDFSAILGFNPPKVNTLFLLRRYNGKSHQHSNKIESQKTFYDFHIHYATERYQKEGLKEEYFAESTDRYSDIHGALKCLFEDCNVISDKDQLEINF